MQFMACRSIFITSGFTVRLIHQLAEEAGGYWNLGLSGLKNAFIKYKPLFIPDAKLINLQSYLLL